MVRKCVLTSDPDCQLCEGLERALNQQFGPGLWAYLPMNLKTLKTRMMGIVYTHTRSRKEQPTLINFCPFCGERLLDDNAKPFHDSKEVCND